MGPEEEVRLEENRRNKRKTLTGIVVSDRMDKTVVVEVVRVVQHPSYKKYIKRKKKYMAHDEENRCKVGDKVIIMESRPLSRHKRWRVIKTIEKAL
jgi:small subunit ribosomal protein S17